MEKPKPKPKPKKKKKAPKISSMMTKEEEACYSRRYTDLNGLSAEEHFMKTGRRQGRNPRCGHVLTWYMAQRYLDRYWKLGD